MQADAVIFEKPGRLLVQETALSDPGGDDVVIETYWSGISTGTERLLWTGSMPVFPGLGYPLVPGYETVGRVIEAGFSAKNRIGDLVFVAGCAAYKEVRGLFGGSASTLVVPQEKVFKIDEATGRDAILLALAATAYHALQHQKSDLPDLVVGYGVLGRLIARLCVTLGGKPPVIWETNPDRHHTDDPFIVVEPSKDQTAHYGTIIDVSGSNDILDQLIPKLARGGEITLAGFYSKPLSFEFPPAFMKEARLRIAAEWQSQDLTEVSKLVAAGKLSLSGLITHEYESKNAEAAYMKAFNDPDCLKMALNWRDAA